MFFFLAGQPFVPLLGVQNDEAIFGGALFQPRSGHFLEIGHSHLPLMLMSYLGALKAWIYGPVFSVFGTGVWAMREPVLLAGAVSIWLFFLLLRRAAGDRAAAIGCGLLAADSIYLLTSCFDWGPVALQHLLLIGGMLLLLRFYQQGGSGALFSGFLLFGLAMWDKALAIWGLGGIGIAAMLLFSRQILRVTTFRRVGISILGFLIGALPLVVFNLQTRTSTFRGQNFTLSELGSKAHQLRSTLDGSGLLGWMVNEDWQAPNPRAPSDAAQAASLALSEAAGRPRHDLDLYAFALALLLAPLARGRELRALLFALIAMAVQWAQMAITAGAGASVHHAVLLWPLPAMAIAASYASASQRLGRAGRPVAGGALAVLMAFGVILTNEYFRMAWRNGPAMNWSDASYPLSEYLAKAHAPMIYNLDWGTLNTLRLMNGGALPLELPPDEAHIRDAAGNPDNLFIAHAKGFEFIEGSAETFFQAAEKAGFARTRVEVIADADGRPTFEIYRFRPVGVSTAP